MRSAEVDVSPASTQLFQSPRSEGTTSDHRRLTSSQANQASKSQQKQRRQDSTEVCAVMKDFEFDGPLAGTRAFLEPFTRYAQHYITEIYNANEYISVPNVTYSQDVLMSSLSNVIAEYDNEAIYDVLDIE